MRTWQVDDVMTTNVVTVRPDTPYREIVDALAHHRVSAAPVVDEDQRVLGVVSEADLLHRIELVGAEHERRVYASRRRRHAHAKAHGGTARALMSAPAITVSAGAAITVAAKKLDTERVKRLPVIGPDGRLRGIVSRSDLLRVYLRPDSEIEHDVVEEVLRRTLWVEPGTVRVKVDQGVVTLTGRTDRHSTRQLALQLTRAVSGVVDVVDELSFEFDDREIAKARHFGPNPFGAP